MRLFIAIELAQEIRKQLAESASAAIAGLQLEQQSRLRLLAAEQLHITLVFLGSVPETRIPEISARLDAAASRSEGFVLTFSGWDCFPERGRVRGIWSELADPQGLCSALHREIWFEMQSLGFEPEKRGFRPHATVARVKEDRSQGALRAAVAEADAPDLQQAVSHVALFSSVTKPEGSEYRVLHRSPFKTSGMPAK